MAIRLGSTPATLRLGSQTITGRLGTTIVTGPTVPGAPTLTYAFWTGVDTVLNVSAPASDGGSAVTAYQFTFDGVQVAPTSFDGEYRFLADYNGQAARVRAVNAIGAGPYSDPVTVEVI